MALYVALLAAPIPAYRTVPFRHAFDVASASPAAIAFSDAPSSGPCLLPCAPPVLYAKSAPRKNGPQVMDHDPLAARNIGYADGGKQPGRDHQRRDTDHQMGRPGAAGDSDGGFWVGGPRV
jgi:hypothetical protein